MDRDELITGLRRTCAVLRESGFEVRPLVFEPPATLQEVEALEDALGLTLPSSFREALLTVSRHVEFRWFAPLDFRFPDPFRDNFCGDLHWSLAFTKQFNDDRASWATDVFNRPDDAYDTVWHDKLAFFEVGNGDYVAFDLAPDRTGTVVYLSHDDGDGHGYVLARDFVDLLNRWVPLACTGGEDWQWLPFVSTPDSGIDPAGPNGTVWRSLLGLR